VDVSSIFVARKGVPAYLCFSAYILTSLALGCGGSAMSGGSGPQTPALAAGIHPLTQVVASPKAGYFSDPLPIHRALADGSYVPSLAGTTAQILACSNFAAGCYTPSALTMTMSPSLRNQLPSGVTLAGYENYNVYQDNAGNWQMAVTRAVNNSAANPNNLEWHVILHASPAAGSPADPTGVPLSWVQDTLLVGSFTTRVGANYDGKYLEDNGRLYLIYSKNLQASPTMQDGIVAQLMTSATQPSSDSPTVLLPPETNSDGGYNSELLECQSSTDHFKLIETGNIAVVSGKYAMAYSTGSYNTPCYKAGIAWSDSLLGPYKKVLQPDPNNVWQNPTPEPEVLYLLQALQPAWPNYVSSTVQGPGVPSLVQYPAGTWYLYFAGYDPSVPISAGKFDPALRRPYVMRLNVAVPDGTTVAATPNEALSTWITAATQ
jgi:hypothetical protein